MKTKILLVEDDHDFGLILKKYLELSGFEIYWVQDPKDVLRKGINLLSFDIGILDIMLPNIDGFSLAKIILERHPDFPILFLTAKNQQIDRITGLKIGADDYISKPCDPEELILRIKNILKRSIVKNTKGEIKIGEYILNAEKLSLSHHKENVRITMREKDLIILFLNYNRQTIKRDEILDKIWKTNDYFTGRSLDVYISKVRKYFRHDESIKIISIRGVGFELEFPES
ncbi:MULTISPECIES: response regulator transcription factor [Chryseobacterium]|uniref:Two-component system response regulator CssR n=1 Tax=Chryseobacterium camelliae TaxID=1265445 RepID=A0ABU0TKX6_9FLAO|nr:MULTISPECIES: response regulator transcription factor [Chryseobacterium]MDT3408489.1 two-component system response regulator CssR [Pseudacidovorax intermedius]MDQ1097656.1 two-component system response regulator CssR [Chryseobacterium camelliae]MDQ1101585.1 two-component system response regulator CssR [Chryseobacterium sp. SORGH_AS_1048]MDR6085028.1 two-component system response regulator CssR [Chryseobacterium sp. SORGH_AS_0909]MDR6129383.1 two-component system response regulator CssR [Chr